MAANQRQQSRSLRPTRRDLLRWGALSAAGLGLAACGGAPASVVTASTSARAATLGSTTASTAAPPSSSVAASVRSSAAPSTAAAAVSPSTTAPPVRATAVTPAGASLPVSWLVRSDMGEVTTKWENQTVSAYKTVAPNVNVQVISVAWANYNEKLLTMFAGGEIPEVFATFAAGFGTFLGKGALAPLNPFLNADKIEAASIFDPEAISEVTRAGNILALPEGHFPTVLTYNATLFEHAGVQPPPSSWSDTSWTLDAMLAAAHKLTQNTNDPARAQWGLIFNAQDLGDMAWLWGVDPFNLTGGPKETKAYETGVVTEAHFDRQKFADAMQWIANLALVEKVNPLSTDMKALRGSALDPFVTGRLGMYLTSPWETVNLSTTKTQWKWGIAPLPYGPGKVNTSPLYNDSFMLGKGSKQIQAGYKFLKYVATDKPSEWYAQLTGFFPARTALYDQTIKAYAAIPGAAQDKSQLLTVCTDAFKTGFPAPGKTLANFVPFSQAWGKASAPLWNGQASAGPTMQQVEGKMKALIAQLAAQ